MVRSSADSSAHKTKTRFHKSNTDFMRCGPYFHNLGDF